MVRIAGRPIMTSAVYSGRKATNQSRDFIVFVFCFTPLEKGENNGNCVTSFDRHYCLCLFYIYISLRHESFHAIYFARQFISAYYWTIKCLMSEAI